MFCTICKREVDDDTIYCPFCGTKLVNTDNTTDQIKIKRHVSITIGIIILIINLLFHIYGIINAAVYSDMNSFFGQLVMISAVSVASYYLWTSKEIGGIVGVIYAIVGIIGIISNIISPITSPDGYVYSSLDAIVFTFLDITLIISLFIGWKSLK